MQSLTLSQETEAYLQDKRIHFLFNEMASELIAKKPQDPLAYLSERLPELRKREMAPRAQQGAQYPAALDERALTIVVMGASGNLARRRVFPALYQLFAQGLLPARTSFVGYGRSALSRQEFERKLEPTLAKTWHETVLKKFFVQCSYITGKYDDPELRSFKGLDHDLKQLEEGRGGPAANRVYYLAVPAEQCVPAVTGVRAEAMSADGVTRVVFEKPFGSDAASSADLSSALTALLTEEQLFRINHHLGKEMAQNIVTLRFANQIFAKAWDRSAISSVQITFKETAGTTGRSKYFDRYGIVRDMMQSHLTPLMALLAMEKPATMAAEHVRDGRVEVLRHVVPAAVGDAVLAQYGPSRDGRQPGYRDDPSIPAGSRTPTFAQVVLKIHNDRWEGVPWILKAAKGADRDEAVVRVQFRPEIRPFGDDAAGRNELVIRMRPSEAMYLKVNAKEPGLTNKVQMTELDLTYGVRYVDSSLPDAYESLLYDACCGHAANFCRSDELDASWRIWTPLLHEADAGRCEVHSYPFGSRGPPAADRARDQHYTRDEHNWSPGASPRGQPPAAHP